MKKLVLALIAALALVAFAAPTVADAAPAKAKATSAAKTKAPTVKPLAPGEKVNINTATVAELERLPSVGPVIAKRIVESRTPAPFGNCAALKTVKGIGVKRFAKIEPYCTTGDK